MAFLSWLQDSTLGTAVRESALMYPFILTLHSIGMAFLVGLNALVDLRILGFASTVPLASMSRFFPVMWLGFWLNAVTGVVLLIQAATQHLTDPVMYVKLVLVASGVVVLRKIHTRVVRGPANLGAAAAMDGRALAIASLVLWTLAITAGRLTAYTFFRFWNW